MKDLNLAKSSYQARAQARLCFPKKIHTINVNIFSINNNYSLHLKTAKKTHNHSTMINLLKYTPAIAKSTLSIPISNYVVTFGHMVNENKRLILI